MSKKKRNKPKQEILTRGNNWFSSDFSYKTLGYAIAFFFVSVLLVALIIKSLLWLKSIDGLVVDKQTRDIAYIIYPGAGGFHTPITKATYGKVTRYNLVLKTTEGKIISVSVPNEVFDKCVVNLNRVKKQRFSLDFEVTEK